jgi:energy-coupling factor transport system ATP-binding protein
MIAVEGLSVRVGPRWLLREASFEVAEGEALLLAGPSGAGKSTLLKVLLHLAPRAASWEVRGRGSLAGLDARATPTPLLARRVGLLFQDVANQLVHADLESELSFRLENLGLPRRDVEERTEGAVRTAELRPLFGRPLHTLSGGELKRAALAAIQAAQPHALLLDEPLGGLDERWSARVAAGLRRPRAATLVVEHRAASLRGRTLHLVDGALRARPARAAPPHRMPPAEGPPLVVAEDLLVRLGGRAILDGLSLEARPGVTLLTGPNGAGKTTLLRAILGLAPVESGRLRVLGRDPAGVPTARLAREVGFVPQQAEAMFFAASAREELAFGPRNMGRADPAHLQGVAASLGLEALLDRHPLTLSGGERQRLALACAIAHRPRLLLLDEPTVGLDAEGLQRLAAALASLPRGAGVLIASHDPALRPLAHRVLGLRGGRVARAAEVAA